MIAVFKCGTKEALVICGFADLPGPARPRQRRTDVRVPA